MGHGRLPSGGRRAGDPGGGPADPIARGGAGATPPDLGRWIRQTALSDPGPHAAALAALPGAATDLSRAARGLLLHLAEAARHGLDPAAGARTTLPVARRLGDILARDPAPLAAARPPGRRSLGTCRDFALLLCAALRQRGVPARLRCGFAAYLGPGWEDHWLCEAWDASLGRWRLIDAGVRDRPPFDLDDVPPDGFMPAGGAWLALRDGRADPRDFGQRPVVGAWFVKVDVARDRLAVGGRETSNWDGWRNAPAGRREVFPADLDWLDAAAREPEGASPVPEPDW